MTSQYRFIFVTYSFCGELKEPIKLYIKIFQKYRLFLHHLLHRVFPVLVDEVDEINTCGLSPRGRECTDLAYKHLGKTRISKTGEIDLFS